MFIYGRELDFGEFGFDWINMVIYRPCSHISLCYPCSNKYSDILYEEHELTSSFLIDLNNFGKYEVDGHEAQWPCILIDSPKDQECEVLKYIIERFSQFPLPDE